MSCALATLAACFSLSGFYADAAIQHSNFGEARYYYTSYQDSAHDYRYATIDNSPTNPYGRLAIGYDIEFKLATFRLEWSHESSLATSRDRGEERVTIGLTVRPFGRR